MLLVRSANAEDDPELLLALVRFIAASLMFFLGVCGVDGGRVVLLMFDVVHAAVPENSPSSLNDSSAVIHEDCSKAPGEFAFESEFTLVTNRCIVEDVAKITSVRTEGYFPLLWY